MKVVPQAFYSASSIKKIFIDGNCCIIYKVSKSEDLDNHRLLSNHALTIVLKGALLIHDDEGIPTQVTSEEMVLLPKGLYAVTDIIPDGEAFEAFVIFFDNEIIREVIRKPEVLNVHLSTHKPGLFKQNQLLNDYLNTFRKLYDTISAPQELCRIKLIETLNYILQIHKDKFENALIDLLQRPIKEIPQFMELHYDKPLDVHQFAALSGMSVATFRRKFHLHFNTSPKKWLIEKRLRRAQEVLKQNRLPVNQVALVSGYSDIPHFIKSFEQRFNISPKKFAQSFA